MVEVAYVEKHTSLQRCYTNYSCKRLKVKVIYSDNQCWHVNYTCRRFYSASPEIFKRIRVESN
jgi:hypothetical protein